MRNIFDEMERFRRLKQSDIEKMIEQQKKLFGSLDLHVRKMIEQQRGLIGSTESVIEKIIKQEGEQLRCMASGPLLNSYTCQMIDQQQRIREFAEPLSKQIAALKPAMDDLARLAGVEGSLQKSLLSISEQFTGLGPTIKEIQQFQSLISSIENPMAECFRDQTRLAELSREIKQSRQDFIEPIKIPFRKPKRSRKRSAERFFKQLRTSIRNVEENLKEDECLIIYHYTEAGEIIFILRVGYQNPDLIVLYGVDTEGRDHQIVGHLKTVRLHIKIDKNPDIEKGNNRWIQ